MACKRELDDASADSSSSMGELESSVVTIVAGSQLGSGFFIAPGIILTNRHVVEQAYSEPVKLVFSRPRTEEVALFTQVDPEFDLAILRCAPDSSRCAGARPLRLGAAAELDVGAMVHAFGSPVGLENTLTRGIISNRNRRIKGKVYLQTDLAVNAGSSGGPLFDRTGAVVGVVSAKMFSAEGIAFALPIEYAVDGLKPVSSPYLHRSQRLSEKMLRMIEDAAATPDLFTANSEHRSEERARRRSQPPPEEYRPVKKEVALWTPEGLDSSFVVTRATIGRPSMIYFRVTVPIDRPVAKDERFELLTRPYNYQNDQQPRVRQLPPMEVENTLDRPEQGTRTYIAKISQPEVSSRQRYHLRFRGRLSQAFEADYEYR